MTSQFYYFFNNFFKFIYIYFILFIAMQMERSYNGDILSYRKTNDHKLYIGY